MIHGVREWRQGFRLKYSRLKVLLADKYKSHLDKKLGDFLKHLKESNDSNYLCFLNKYGDNKFCKFNIYNHLNDKGIYCYIKNDKIKYIGRCTDNFKKRINHGYGKIHPKNCFNGKRVLWCMSIILVPSCSTGRRHLNLNTIPHKNLIVEWTLIVEYRYIWTREYLVIRQLKHNIICITRGPRVKNTK